MTTLTDIVHDTLAKETPQDWQPTGITRAHYLDLAEQIVTTAATWLDDEGAIIDPVEHEEWGQTTSRFISSAAVLLSEGRCTTLLPRVVQAMDRCCHRLSQGKAASPDFWTRELVTAYEALQPLAPDRADAWARDLQAIIPESIYWQVEKDDVSIDDLHNWTVYAAAGEAMRARAGLGPEENTDIIWGYDFFAKYMPPQRKYFTANGMYRDPGDPITYDLTTRIHLELALEAGAAAAHPELAGEFDRHLSNGALATLLLVSPDGLVPYGGRSSQYHMQEIMVALNCEMAANRWKTADPNLAGAFKRQAHLSLNAIQPWFALQPFRCLKNSFPPERQHGHDPYGKYGVYSLLTASLCVLAAQHADDSIDERPAPAEIGSYVFELSPAFHKIIASCGGTQAVIDTNADLHYDATGLGRVCHAAIPPALCLGMPLCPTTHVTLPDNHLAHQPAAIGPTWRTQTGWTNLAALQPDTPPALTINHQDEEQVAWSLQWTDNITEHFTLTSGQLVYQFDCPRPNKLLIPLLITDGTQDTQITHDTNQISVQLGHHQVRYTFLPQANTDLRLDESDQSKQANRHGLYRLLSVENCQHVIMTFHTADISA